MLHPVDRRKIDDEDITEKEMAYSNFPMGKHTYLHYTYSHS